LDEPIIPLSREHPLASTDALGLKVDLVGQEGVDLAHLHLVRVVERPDLVLEPFDFCLEPFLLD
jgi:hypothetical protein